MAVSKNDFIKQYADRSEVDIDELLATHTVEPCACGAGRCQGWAMISKTEKEQVRGTK